MRTTNSAALLFLCGLLAAGCGDCGGSRICDPGQTATCACSGFVVGTKQCNAQGSSFGECSCSEDAGAGACAAGQSPSAGVAATNHDFGQVHIGQSAEFDLHIASSGSCALLLQSAALDGGSNPEFSCASCSAAHYPRAVDPGAGWDIHLVFAPLIARAYSGTLVVVTNDPGVADGTFRIALSGTGVGPRMEIDPTFVDFGYVAPTAAAVNRTITVRSTGTEPLQILRAYIGRSDGVNDMQAAPLVGPTDPAIEVPVNGSTQFSVTYDPGAIMLSRAALYLESNEIGHTCPVDPGATRGIGCVELRGDSRQPGRIEVSLARIDFGTIDIGDSLDRLVTLDNSGQSDLRVSVALTGNSSTDFSYSPLSTALIASGSSAFLTVYYRASVVGAVAGDLLFNSSDPSRPTVHLPLSGTGRSTSNDDTIKIEMTFENDAQGFFNGDFRDVNLYLESPWSEICDKELPAPDWSHGGGDTTDNFGHPRWNANGVLEEPEVVTLLDAARSATGTFKGCVSYREDCSFMPTDELASLTGLGLSVLLEELSSGAIAPDDEQLSAAVRENCWSHSGSSAELITYVNGQRVATTQVVLDVRGSVQCPVIVDRHNGRFCVQGASSLPPECL